MESALCPVSLEENFLMTDISSVELLVFLYILIFLYSCVQLPYETIQLNEISQRVYTTLICLGYSFSSCNSNY